MSSAQNVEISEIQQGQLRVLPIAMIVVPTIIILLRAWSRALLPVSPTSHITTKFWWDDWMVFAAGALNIANCGMGLKLVDYGLGQHVQDVPPENLYKFLKILWAVHYTFDIGTVLSKASALFFYDRVLSANNSRFKHALWLVHAMNFAWLFARLFGDIFMCSPVQKAWNPALPGKCLNTGWLWTGFGVTGLLIDVIILIMPLPVLWKLRITTLRRIQICAVFVLGYLVVVVSIGRLVTILEAGDQIDLDPTYKLVLPLLWLGSEIAIAIVCVSLPSILFLGQRAHRNGFRSLFQPSAQLSKTGLISSGTNHPYHEESDENGLVMRTRAHSHRPSSGSSGSDPYLGRTKAMVELGGPNAWSTEHNGIHVVRGIEVA
ncbi:hypothetical protein PFICI_12309 [Pestalotiopsis fici W106-1]|uniref:Rhodopsin domain-containing protein n=1 Tax=Pestalotiopsis fici (strain W106-1 / CGMCC3.15140) TaxID=1229662 RepID=W3WN72_PESFW|nr:uncharacterized protein PFICI_12309 [Pestalotiopsis fici W106-1]ETS75365.1 hypothetical protein PFICI_12309 [Pestalotiopsis fici W106-1]